MGWSQPLYKKQVNSGKAASVQQQTLAANREVYPESVGWASLWRRIREFQFLQKMYVSTVVWGKARQTNKKVEETTLFIAMIRNDTGRGWGEASVATSLQMVDQKELGKKVRPVVLTFWCILFKWAKFYQTTAPE